VPALPSSILEPLWVQVAALLPTRPDTHPLGCHRPRIPDRIVFDKLVQLLVFGCGYRRIADATCSAPPCAAAATNGSAPGWPSSSA
jgi:transposase